MQHQPWLFLPVSFLVILAIVSMFHLHQIAFLFLPNECSTCLVYLFPKQPQPTLRQRSIVTFDEFFYRGPSLEILQQFFHYDIELYVDRFYGNNSATYFQFHPLWQRSTHYDEIVDSNMHNTTNNDRMELVHSMDKLIFIHTSRTAGSTIRAILRAYSVKRNKTLLSINRCWDVNYEFMESIDTWRNGRYANPRTNTAFMDCLATLYSNDIRESTLPSTNSTSQDSAERSTDNSRPDRVSTTYLQEHDIDILSGHVPLGCEENWIHPTGDLVHVNPRYVVFFRHPIHQFVSEFVIRTMQEGDDDTRSVVDIVSQIQVAVSKASRDRSYYEPLSSHAFITPKQMAWVERQSNILWTSERRINVTRMNLLQNTNRVLIGLVERMPESLSMLQYLIDPHFESTLIFQYFTTQTSTLDNVQRSLNRTRSIVHSIQNDVVLRSLVEEYIKYETQIYSLAVQIHDRQFRWFQEQIVPNKTGNDS